MHRRLIAPGLGLAAVAACTVPDSPHWTDQLVADDPCFRVDLMDGLDEESTEELRDLYGCVNQEGQLDSLGPTVDALEITSRAGHAAGRDAARAINALPDAGIDPFALGGVALDLLRAEDRPIEEFLDIFLELTYGEPAREIRAGQVGLTDPDALSNGVLTPLAPVLPVAAGAMLDDDLAMARFAGDLLQDPETHRWVRTVGAWAESDDPRVADPIRRLPEGLGELILATRSPGNDHYASASGDSLRDLADVFAGDDPLLDDLSDECDAMLGDVVVRTKLEAQVDAWYGDGRLDTLPEQVALMASVDVDGGSLDAGEVSGLHALIRLLHDTNRPMRCSFDLWVTDLDIDLGNLAVTLLEMLAGANPDVVQTGVGVLGAILDWGLTEWVLDEVADSEVCPVLSPRVVSDLKSVDLIYDDRLYDLLVVFIDTLDVMKNGQANHIPDIADLATELYDGGGVEPIEELIRDVGDERAIDDVVDLVPVLLDPGAYGIAAGDEEAVDLQDGLGLLVSVFEPDGDGETGWDQLQPLVSPVLAEGPTWVTLGNAADLLTTPDTQTSRAIDLIPPLLAVDPDLVTLQQLGPLLGNDAIARPLLTVVDTPGVADEMLATSPHGADPEVPLAFVSRLIKDGTVDEVLTTIDVIVGSL